MIVTVNSQQLAVELRLLNKIVPTKPAIAILSHVLINAEFDALHLYSTDFEVGLSTSCRAQVEEPGTVALPVGKLLAMVEQFPDADVNIRSDKKQTIVKCGAFKSQLQALSADDFPKQPETEGTSCMMPGNVLSELIIRTRYSVSSVATKHVLQGSLLTIAGPAAAMAATDGKRLALSMAACPEASLRVIIPMKMLDVLIGQLGEEDVELTVGKNQSFFKVDDRLFISRLFEGEFPKYDRIIPRDNDKTIVVDRNMLAAALRRVLVAAENNSATYVTVEPGRMEVVSSSVEVGSADESIAVEYAGSPLKVCINGNYVLDFLNAARGQTVEIKLKDQKTAAMLSDGPDNLAVVMVMRP
ncbi:MAG TPA: DNA polymerase III subunit beta [Sphingomicrobium sp.]|nr:DNA polymerase III subunit beta [Sphingomicrobium sp.]